MQRVRRWADEGSAAIIAEGAATVTTLTYGDVEAGSAPGHTTIQYCNSQSLLCAVDYQQKTQAIVLGHRQFLLPVNSEGLRCTYGTRVPAGLSVKELDSDCSALRALQLFLSTGTAPTGTAPAECTRYSADNHGETDAAALMPRGGRARKSELIVAATAATGSLLYCWFSARQEDLPPPAHRFEGRPLSAAVPTRPTRRSTLTPAAQVLGGGIFEQLDDDMVLLVLQHICKIAPEPAGLNVAADAAAAALISVGGINRQWRRLSGLRCFWMPLCQHHFGIGTAPVECPRWCDETGPVPPLQVHRAQSSKSYYDALGLDEGASAQEIAAAYAKAVRDAAAISTGTFDLAVQLARPSEESKWRKCWLSWHTQVATQIGHTHTPLQRRPGGMERRQPLLQPGNRPISGHVWCRVVDCWRRIHNFCAFSSCHL